MISLVETRAVTEALLQWRGRAPWPTEFGSSDLRAFSAELRMRSVFSARVTNAEFLAELQATIDGMLSGRINLATGRLQLMRKLKELGYDPAVGFPQDMASVPPAERGSLRDVSSERRLDLMLETNQRVAANYGRAKAGQTAYARFAYPAWQLVRIFTRSVPRGTPESRTAGWQQRWQDAGESVDWEGAFRGEMIARKDSPIWQALGDGAGGYEDTLGNPFPPFAFGSGMGWRGVKRDEAQRRGLIDRERAAATPLQLSPRANEINAAIARLPAELRAQLEEELA